MGDELIEWFIKFILSYILDLKVLFTLQFIPELVSQIEMVVNSREKILMQGAVFSQKCNLGYWV